ncbi:MAG: SpoIIE family protein phosphatase [Anaerolineae bacterium]
MLVQLGAAKVSKYATSESGDTLEIIERPHGGVSAVLVDGQRSGRAAKIISNIVARKAISLLGEGVRDGAAARATHDYLRTHRSGQVSAELQLVSVDLSTKTIVISRNTRCPAFVARQGTLLTLQDNSQAIGIYPNTKPVIVEYPIEADTYVLACTDGLTSACGDEGESRAVVDLMCELVRQHCSAQVLADAVIAQALEAQSNRPRDDISVLVLAVLPGEMGDGLRRYAASFPI